MNKQEWHLFGKDRPELEKYVLVLIRTSDPFTKGGIGVGFLKREVDDNQSYYFVVPELFPGDGEVVAWCDCLPEDFEWPIDHYSPRNGGSET